MPSIFRADTVYKVTWQSCDQSSAYFRVISAHEYMISVSNHGGLTIYGGKRGLITKNEPEWIQSNKFKSSTNLINYRCAGAEWFDDFLALCLLFERRYM